MNSRRSELQKKCLKALSLLYHASLLRVGDVVTIIYWFVTISPSSFERVCGAFQLFVLQRCTCYVPPHLYSGKPDSTQHFGCEHESGMVRHKLSWFAQGMIVNINDGFQVYSSVYNVHDDNRLAVEELIILYDFAHSMYEGGR